MKLNLNIGVASMVMAFWGLYSTWALGAIVLKIIEVYAGNHSLWG